MPRPRIIKSHQYFDPRFPRIIYVVRDPRDVLLSGYYFQRKRRLIDDHYPFEKYAARFMAGDFNPYAAWGDNVASWLATRYNQPGFLLLRYEDMLSNTAQELAKVAVFLGIDPDPERIATAVRRSDVSSMRKLEESQALLWSSTRETRQDIRFVRTAKAGGWRTEVPESAILQLEAQWGHLMTFLGYELHSSPQATGLRPLTALLGGASLAAKAPFQYWGRRETGSKLPESARARIGGEEHAGTAASEVLTSKRGVGELAATTILKEQRE